MNLRWDVIAWNAAADELFDFSGRAQVDRNMIRMVFADPDLRRRLPEWKEDAPRLVAQFRYDLAAAALGAHGEYVTEASELDAALSRALKSGKAACVNVMIEGLPAPSGAGH